ncbi:8795_t:CDS:1, partial [Gigaspora margarita]
KYKNSEQEVPRERLNSYQNDKDLLDNVQNLFNYGYDYEYDYQNGVRIDNSKYKASEYNQALTSISLGLSYFYQNGINRQSISISYQKSTKISSTCPLVRL